MSNRRRIKHRNDKAVKVIKPAFNWKRKEGREREIEHEKAMSIAKDVYIDWAKEFTSKARKLEELPAEFERLRIALIRRVTDKEVLESALYKAGQALKRAKTEVLVKQNTLRVAWDCPHEIAVNGKPVKCGAGGQAAFHKEQWGKGEIDFKCPKCKGSLTQKDMITESDLKAMGADRRWK